MNRAWKLSRFAALTLAGAALLVSPAPSRAYKMDNGLGVRVNCDNFTGVAHWNTRSITWYHNTQNQGAGKRTALENALQTWSSVSDTSYSLTLAAGSVTQGMSLSDNQNTFVWDAASYCGTQACHAITFLDVNNTTQEITEADIVFNNTMTWNTNGTFTANCATNAAAGTAVDTQAVATHELGHSLGIHHLLSGDSGYSTATMGAQACTLDGRDLSDDDKEGLRCTEDRYPISPSYEGYFEAATCSSLSGWAWNSNRPNRPIYVEIKDGSNTIAVVTADDYRGDLLAAGKGNGYHGFTEPPSISVGAKRTIYTRFNSSGTNLTWSPRDMACNILLLFGRLPYQILDNGGTTYTVGTQFSSSQAGKIKEIWYFKATGETATGQLRMWNDGGGSPIATVLSPTCRPPGIDGLGQWCGGAVSSPVTISANTLYRVGVETYTKQAKSPCGTTNSLSSPILKWPLTAQQGVWSSGNTFPSTGSCANFFVDVVFDS